MTDPQQASYDELPYESKPWYPTHPECQATVATLFGLRPPAVTSCRVLELGCGTGGNLLPMALALPGSRFVGLDLSPRQVALGRAAAEALGLANVELHAGNLLDVDDGLGRFDYVICHGVYSWVPPPVQDKILTICRRNLSPDGVACVSYNTYPGWHMRGLVRGMLGFHAGPVAAAAPRARQARAFLDALAAAAPDPNSVYAHVLKQEAALLRGESDTYLFHEHLEEVNEPVYFHEFLARAAGHGLRYLADAWPGPDGPLPPAIDGGPRPGLPERVRRAQYRDFLTGRAFRATLLCHDALTPREEPDPAAVAGLLAAGCPRPAAPPGEATAGAPEEFRGPDGALFTTADPLLRAALLCLAEAWPRALAFDDLAARAAARLPAAPAGGPGVLAGPLLGAYLAHVVELHVHAPAYVPDATERPLASPLARLQAADSPRVTNLWHRTVDLGPLDRVVLRLLDGTRDRAALLDALADLAASDVLTIRREGRPLRDAAEARELLGGSLGPCLRRLARAALLVG
jgi:SAM-dependent methyltransferase/methyltransferase-like protein